jgi:hypothetical protein
MTQSRKRNFPQITTIFMVECGVLAVAAIVLIATGVLH